MLAVSVGMSLLGKPGHMVDQAMKEESLFQEKVCVGCHPSQSLQCLLIRFG